MKMYNLYEHSSITVITAITVTRIALAVNNVTFELWRLEFNSRSSKYNLTSPEIQDFGNIIGIVMLMSIMMS